MGDISEEEDSSTGVLGPVKPRQYSQEAGLIISKCGIIDTAKCFETLINTGIDELLTKD